MQLTGIKGAAGAVLVSLGIMASANAAPISGQGTWEMTLQGRDLDGNASTFEAYYDTVLDITWAANANINGKDTWQNQKDWAAGLDIGGVTGWHLPTMTPVNSVSFNATMSTDGTSDRGTATTTTTGSDGGWRDASGNPVSEMGHLYYVTLGNKGYCDPTLPWCTQQTDKGLVNKGPFSNIQGHYWFESAFLLSGDPEFIPSNAWTFQTGSGLQNHYLKDDMFFAWAVRSGDIGAVPVPAAVWLFGSGLFGLIGVARHKRANI